MKILISGDYAPKNRVNLLLGEKNYSFFSQVKFYTSDVDYSIVNLESPILNRKQSSPISKVGPNLKCSKNTISSIKYAGFNCVTLANNHFRDYGQAGVEDTINLCIDNKIDYVGGGRSIVEASQILYVSKNNKNIAILNYCEHEWSIATSEYGGSNSLDLIKIYYDIDKARKNADYILIIIHGGVETYNLPSPRMKQIYRYCIDLGADAIVNHHQHCFSGYEIYKNKPIFYGLGNFCFDKNNSSQSWEQGYVVIISFESDITFKILPYYQCTDKFVGVDFKVDYNQFNVVLNNLNNIIKDDLKLKFYYQEYMNSTNIDYELKLTPFFNNKYLSYLYKKGLLPYNISKLKIKYFLSLIQCESHRSRLIHCLENLMSTKH